MFKTIPDTNPSIKDLLPETSLAAEINVTTVAPAIGIPEFNKIDIRSSLFFAFSRALTIKADEHNIVKTSVEAEPILNLLTYQKILQLPILLICQTN